MTDDLTPEDRHGPPSRKEWIAAVVIVLGLVAVYFLSRFGMM